MDKIISGSITSYFSFRLRGDFLPNSYSSKIYLSDGEEALLIREDK